HAGLVCLCGRAIYRKLLPEIGVYLSYDSWQRFATFLLGNAILEYPTFMRMKDALLNENSISSPLVRWVVLQQIIPHVFPTSPKVDVPYHPSTGTLDILEVLKQVIRVFDQETIKSCNSFKLAHVLVSNANNQEVPKESVYDAELYRIMSNWLVISRPDHPTIALELLATATKKELKKHYERALLYDKKLPVDKTWVVYFTCCEGAISEPYWPTES
ncbi:33186_t:CDS:2, partial [Racocetra persica]